ncbi:MAG: 50S ribosomal protein L5 [Bacillati bacterium ANGP1]|uniref:Large ribosomal subunit protein uL5 n=1 Tax=Candidatus Segetimicrobium genomatis TaxID=2569760 RepID=A0A537L5F6_9BACT|nr:MAG: 50S ribosomal protein L5 [Terrabacteria group bacterium ANGP1]
MTEARKRGNAETKKGKGGDAPAPKPEQPKGDRAAKPQKPAVKAADRKVSVPEGKGPVPEVKAPSPERKAPAPERKAPAAVPVERTAEEPARAPARLKEQYRKETVPRLQERFRYRNVMEVPRLEKVVINVRVGDATTDSRFLDKAVEELTVIAGQRPVIPRAKKSIAAFKLRQGIPIAAKVTLRGDRMYQFVDKLFNIALPRIKDFKGISERQFDGRGNLNIGVREQLIFPEIDYDKVEKVRGMDITLVTTAQTDEEARELLRLLGLPLREAGAAAT